MEKEISTVPIVEDLGNKAVTAAEIKRLIADNEAIIKELICPHCGAKSKGVPNPVMKMLCVEDVLKEIDDSADKPERDIKEAMYGERLDREAIHCTCPRCGKEADIVKWIGASSLEYNQQLQLEQDRAKAYFMETKTAEAAKAFEDYIQGLHCSRCNTNGAIVVQNNHSYDIACGECGATLMDSSMYNLEFKGIKVDAIIKHIFK